MKLALARILSKASELGLRLIGPEALARQGAWQNQFLGAPALHIAGGTDEVQKNVAAERVLGLPREPRRTRTCPSRICRGASTARAHRIGKQLLRATLQELEPVRDVRELLAVELELAVAEEVPTPRCANPRRAGARCGDR